MPTTSLKGASALEVMLTFISVQPWVGVSSVSGLQKRSMYTVPGLMPSVTLTAPRVRPRFDSTQAQQPSVRPYFSASEGCIQISGTG